MIPLTRVHISQSGMQHLPPLCMMGFTAGNNGSSRHVGLDPGPTKPMAGGPIDGKEIQELEEIISHCMVGCARTKSARPSGWKRQKNKTPYLKHSRAPHRPGIAPPPSTRVGIIRTLPSTHRDLPHTSSRYQCRYSHDHTTSQPARIGP